MVVLNIFRPLGFGSSVIGGWDKNMHSGFAKIVLPHTCMQQHACSCLCVCGGGGRGRERENLAENSNAIRMKLTYKYFTHSPYMTLKLKSPLMESKEMICGYIIINSH